jgi:hypothetical protein
MRILLKKLFLFNLILLVLLTSCRSEDLESIQTPPDETLEANSYIATLMQRTSMNDGSNDNIIDDSNCFNIQFPLTVTANGIEITVNSEDDYEQVEAIFDEDDDNIGTISMTYPITIILNDFTEVVVNNATELYSHSSNCNGENESDDDIECLDFQYPITASIFNSNNELISTESLTNDYQLYEFIDNIDENDLVSIHFPVTIILSDQTQIVVNNLTELANAIETHENDCDEDDDNNFNDDDCNNCTPSQLSDVLTNCTDWVVDKLKRNSNDYDAYYDGYTFNFFIDGTVSAYWSNTTAYGTWITTGSGNNITVVIDISGLPYCNNNWNLHEIEINSGETKVDLRVGDDDRLRYENNCN